MLCLVTGATGYVGGRLVPRLLAEGHTVRCLARSPVKLRDVPWADHVEVVRGDVLDVDSMRAACSGVEVLYYLVHSLTESGFATLDRQAALRTAQACHRTTAMERSTGSELCSSRTAWPGMPTGGP